jgi:hypothetical protein
MRERCGATGGKWATLGISGRTVRHDPRAAAVSRRAVDEDGDVIDILVIRALIEAILLEPDGDHLKITLKGDLVGMLSAARDSKRSPDTGDLLVQIKLVAGARNPLDLEFSWSAA